jgi:uncharacterized Zn finger protein
MSRESFNLTPFLFSFAELRRAFPPETFESGLAYARQLRVQSIGPGGDAAEIEALTKGSRPVPYRQTIRHTIGGNGRRGVLGRCTCPIGWNVTVRRVPRLSDLHPVLGAMFYCFFQFQGSNS